MLAFIDANGVEAEITDDLRSTYEGEWEDELYDYLENLQAEFSTDDGNFDKDQLCDEVIITLSQHLPVTRVNRIDT